MLTWKLAHASQTEHGLLFLAMEAVTGGDLRELVLRAMMEPTVYTDADVVRWAHDIARGLHYLHTRSPMVVHRDLKLENIMLDGACACKRYCLHTHRRMPSFATRSRVTTARPCGRAARWNAKITDFGLVKTLLKPRASEAPAAVDATYKMTGGTGSLKYMAPESFRGKPASEKVDNYSWSIIVWELLARCMLLFMRSKPVGHHGKQEYTPRCGSNGHSAG
jgi:serine/threonine protein kinase